MKTQIVLKSFDALSFQVFPTGNCKETAARKFVPTRGTEASADRSTAQRSKVAKEDSTISGAPGEVPVFAAGLDDLRAGRKRTEARA